MPWRQIFWYMEPVGGIAQYCHEIEDPISTNVRYVESSSREDETSTKKTLPKNQVTSGISSDNAISEHAL